MGRGIRFRLSITTAMVIICQCRPSMDSPNGQVRRIILVIIIIIESRKTTANRTETRNLCVSCIHWNIFYIVIKCLKLPWVYMLISNLRWNSLFWPYCAAFYVYSNTKVFLKDILSNFYTSVRRMYNVYTCITVISCIYRSIEFCSAVKMRAE